MRRRLAVRVAAVSAVALLAVPAQVLATSRDAAAFTPPPEGGLALVSNQNAGCANDQHVVVATPKANGAFSSSLGKPASVNGMLNDAKPFDENRQVIAIWGQEPQHGRLGGVGIYDRTATPPAWTTAFPLPSGWTVGNDFSGLAHSVTAIEQPDVDGPDVVVAQTGGIPGENSWGNVVLFRPTSGTAATVEQTLPLKGVHAVEWDTARNTLYALGDDYIESYSYDASREEPLQRVGSWQLKAHNGVRGGHDLRRRRTTNTYFVTTNTMVWTFNPDIVDPATAITQYGIGGGVKSIDERFDGLVEYSYGDGQFHFNDGTAPKAATGFCMREYKVRWMYAPNDPVWNNDDATAPQPEAPAAGSAERFLWEQHWLTGTQDLAHSGQIWAGGGTNNSMISSGDKVSAAINAGKIPYVKFYHWGDSGNPKMSGVGAMGPGDSRWKTWSDYAAEMAKRVGPDREATFIIEPEWDTNPEAPCNPTYQATLKDVIGKFHTFAPKAKIVNGVGFWDEGKGNYPDGLSRKYHCFTDPSSLPGGAPLYTLFDGHGFVEHRMSNGTAPDGDHCGLHANGSTYGGGTSLQTAIAKMNLVPTLLDRIRSIFHTDKAYITDVMVTRCGWGDSGQAQIIGALTDKLQNNASNLYATHGLRGVAFRDAGPPGLHERFCGVDNEGMVNYGSNSATLAKLESARAGTQAFLASIAGPTDPPAFTLTVSNPPSVAPGGTARLLLTVANTKGTLTNGIVDIEVYTPGGTRAEPGQQTWPGQSFTNTQSRQYAYDWPAATAPGTYTIKAGVFTSGWQNISWKENAGTIVVGTAQPSFSATASAAPATVQPDASTTISATVTDSGGPLTDGVVTLMVIEPGGLVEREWEFTGESFTSGQAKPYSATWTAPAAGGAYKLGVRVTGTGGSPTHYDRRDLATVTVSPSKFTSSVSLSRGTVAPGGTSTVTTTITNTGTAALVNGIVDVEFYDPSGGSTQTYWTGVNLAVGASAPFTTTWTAPATTGGYTVKVGVFTTGWANTLHWNQHAAELMVAAVKFDLQATATPSKVMPGGPTTITVSVQPIGGSVDGAIVDVEVFNPAGVRITNGQRFWTGQTLNNGTTYEYTWSPPLPATLGTYTVKAGVFPAGWGPVYKWVENADQIEVANPSHTLTATVSASSVSSGSTVTITATYTNNGGAMTNGILDMEVYDPAGQRQSQPTWPGTSLDNGHTTTRTHTWTAPAVPGTYTVRLGVFSSDWSKQWGWNNAAATISVGSGSFQPSFQVGSGANSWWFEIWASNDVTSVDVIADNGRIYQTLPKKSWGAFAAAPPSAVPAGQTVQLIARRSSDGASASSTAFAWLSGTPSTVPGWVANIARGSGSSATWVEASASAAATEVWVKAGQGAWTLLTYSAASGKWGKAMNVSAGTKVVFKAKRADNAWSYSTIYSWLQ